MYKFLLHRTIRLHTFFLWVALLFSSLSFAQVEVHEDSVVHAAPQYFDPVPLADTGMITERKIPDSIVQRVKSDDDYWYANLAPAKQEIEKPKEKRSWINSVLWILIIAGFLAVLVWYLASSNINLFRKESARIAPEEDDSLLTEDIFELQYEKEIHKAVAGGNYRLAIRLHYLGTLKSLADAGLINYKHELTNSHYLAQLSGTTYYRDFFRLTRDFDYAWYGRFDISKEIYEAVAADFMAFKKGISR